jgi:hypothetical protein
MEIQNLINLVYNKNSSMNNDVLSRLNVGDIFKAKVTAMLGDLITLEMHNNLTLEAKDASAIGYNVGDTVEFIVSDKIDDKLFIKSNISSSHSLEDKLSQMGIKVDDNNKDLIELLYKNQIPITKDNVDKLLSTKNYYGKLAEFVKNNDIPISSQMINDDIKEVLKNLIQREIEITAEKINVQDDIHHNGERVIAKENVDKNVPIEVNKTNLEVNKANTDTIFIKDLFDNNSNISLEKLVFMLKNNMNFSTKNFALLNNIILGEKTITNQIQGLLKELEKNDGTKEIDRTEKNNKEINNKEINTKNQLIDLLRKFDISNLKEKDKFNSIMKELFERLETIKDSSLGIEAKSIVNKHIEELKTSLDFVNKLNDNINFIQVPLHVNNSLKNLDIYINKDAKPNKKKSENGTNIFISLNTNNLDLVQVLIELNKKDLSLNFRVHNEKVKNIIKFKEKILYDSLNKYDFNSILFKYKVSEESINLTNIDMDNKSRLNTLDIRV